MNQVVTKRVVIALNLPYKISDLIIKAKAILQAMRESPYFTDLTTELDALNTNVTALETAEVNFTSKFPTISITERNIAVTTVCDDLRDLKVSVQGIANANSDNATSIILSAGMDIKKESTYIRKTNVAIKAPQEGTVKLYGQGAGAHEWQISTDNSQWSSLPATMTSTTTVSGLSSGTYYYFRCRKMLRKNQKSKWSDSFSIGVF